MTPIEKAAIQSVDAERRLNDGGEPYFATVCTVISVVLALTSDTDTSTLSVPSAFGVTDDMLATAGFAFFLYDIDAFTANV